MTQNGDRRDHRIDEVKGEVGVLRERIDSLTVTVDRTYAAVAGNGKPGLGERVSLLESRARAVDYWTTMFLRPLIPVGIILLGMGGLLAAVMYIRDNF